MATKKFSDYAIEGQNVTLTYDNVNDTVTFDVVVDKNDVGLGNVDNTSDANKPISSATQTELNGKQDTLVSGTNIKTINSNTLLGSGDVVIDKTSIGLGNVANVDTTNASNISSGTLGDARLSTNVTTQGNTFNAANKLVQLDATAKLPAVDGSQLTNLPSFTPPNGLLKIASTISTTFQVVKDYLDNVSVLFLNSRRVGIGKDTSVTTQSVAVVEVQDTNTSIVLKPNGTGGIIASVPDGTATGGNARGQYSVDLQMSRTAADQTALNNYSVISGGRENKIAAGGFEAYTVISGGYQNNNNSSYSFIGGGDRNTSSARYTSIPGGSQNTTSSQFSTVSGGQSNTASTNTHATVVGGQSNTSSGQFSISGGNTNTASGSQSIAIGTNNISAGTFNFSIGNANNSNGYDAYCFGKSNTTSSNRTFAYGTTNNVSGLDALAFGNANNVSSQAGIAFGRSNNVNTGYGGVAFGISNIVTGIEAVALGYAANANGANSICISNEGKTDGISSVAMGLQSLTYLQSQISQSSGTFTGVFLQRGDAQQSLLTARRQASLTTAATTVLSLDGTGTTNLIIPNGNNRAWNVQIDTIAVVTAITGTATGVSVGDVYRETKQLLFKRIGGTSSIVGSVDTSAIKNDTSMSTASITITAGASQQMAITFTAPTFAGGGSVTCRVVSKVSLVEVAY